MQLTWVCKRDMCVCVNVNEREKRPEFFLNPRHLLCHWEINLFDSYCLPKCHVSFSSRFQVTVSAFSTVVLNKINILFTSINASLVTWWLLCVMNLLKLRFLLIYDKHISNINKQHKVCQCVWVILLSLNARCSIAPWNLLTVFPKVDEIKLFG